MLFWHARRCAVFRRFLARPDKLPLLIVAPLEAAIHHATTIGDAAGGDTPESFEYRVHLMQPDETGNVVPLKPGMVASIPPGGTSELWCAFVWKLPPDPPPALALGTASFQLAQSG
jgi:hypothetical protein